MPVAVGTFGCLAAAGAVGLTATAGGLTIVANAIFGIPVSTTHTITGAIVGVGASRRLTAVRWGITRRIVWAWVLTIPGAALIGAGLYHFLAPLLNMVK